MVFYDDKVAGVTNNKGNLSIDAVQANEDITFKASFVVTGDLSCAGKVTGLFDLIVLGNVYAKEIDVKGRFVCLGECVIEDSVVVQYDIYANTMRAESVVGREQIVAGSMDVGTVSSEGNIIVSKVLSVNNRAETQQKILCGETAYGSGAIAAACVLTGEPLDMDDGDEIETPPCKYESKGTAYQQNSAPEKNPFIQGNDFKEYIYSCLIPAEESKKATFERYLEVLKKVEMFASTQFTGVKDAALLLSMIELSNSPYFSDWETIRQWTQEFRDYFSELIVEKAFDASKLKPIYDLRVGLHVWHEKYKKGIVENIIMFNGNRFAEVLFEDFGKKKFTALEKSGKFKKIEDDAVSSTSGKGSVQCDVRSYSEWISAIHTLENNKEFLGKELYVIINELLIDKMGLKGKYIEDRFKPKR